MTDKNQTTSDSATVTEADVIAELAYQALTKNIPFYLLNGLTKRQMDALYVQGYDLYSQAKYKEALPFFQALTFYNYLDQAGWLGAAGCYEMLKKHEQAISLYSFAAILNLDDPIPALHSFDCYLALKNYPKALACLETVILLSSKKPENAALKKRAEFLRDALHKAMLENQNS
jgi:type III secretion system low calcium response chaperone LcrH/SycD